MGVKREMDVYVSEHSDSGFFNAVKKFVVA